MSQPPVNHVGNIVSARWNVRPSFREIMALKDGAILARAAYEEDLPFIVERFSSITDPYDLRGDTVRAVEQLAERADLVSGPDRDAWWHQTTSNTRTGGEAP